MPRFYFHLHNSIDVLDEEGLDLANMSAALRKAILTARRIIASEIADSGELNLSHWIEIEDQKGVKTPVRFGDCVTVKS